MPAIATPSVPQPAIDGGTVCTAFPLRAFHLRATPARASTGREIQPEMVTVLERGTLQRGNATIHRVRTASGATGWMFLAPSELGSGCGSQPAR
jgi:hypothetical protein